MNKEIKWYQIREALLDPQVWILFLFTLLNEIINGGIANVRYYHLCFFPDQIYAKNSDSFPN